MQDEWMFVGEFAAKVIEYIRMEWELDIFQFSPHHQKQSLKTIAELEGKQSVPNIAAKISMDLPL